MTNIVKSLIVTAALIGGAFASSAYARPDTTYHWAYPDSVKSSPSIPQHSIDGSSGLPAQYR